MIGLVTKERLQENNDPVRKVIRIQEPWDAVLARAKEKAKGVDGKKDGNSGRRNGFHLV